MHCEKLVVAIKVNGQVLRETGDTVSLPFGSEYSIFIKNLDSARAQVNVSVDGSVAGDNLVIAPNSSLDLERFIRNGNLDAGNRFKFIERSADVEKHRGISADDGIIRVEGWRERVVKVVDVPVPRYYDVPYPVPRPYYPPTRPWPRPWPYGAMGRAGGPRPQHPTARGRSTPPRPDLSAKLGPTLRSMSMHTEEVGRSDAGITVPGSESQQKFQSVRGFPLEANSVVVVLHLRGVIGEIVVSKPVTVKTKNTCSTCGRTEKSGVNFCSRCGTAMVLA